MVARKIKTRKLGRKTNKYSRSSKRTVRRHRTSVAGKIMPPLDVRSSKHLKEFEKRIKTGPLTILLVYADWCGHCHTMMPHFDAASKSPNRSIQAVKVNEQMLSNVNSTINKSINKSAKSINVEGYPSIIVVDKKGNEVTQMEPVRNTETMTKVMNNAASIGKNAGINNSMTPNVAANTSVKNEIKNIVANKPTSNNKENLNAMTANIGVEEVGLAGNSSPKNINVGEESLKGSMASVNNKNKSISLKAMSPEKMANNANINEEINEGTNEVPTEAISPSTNMNKSIEETANEPLVPPSVSSDMEDNVSISNSLNAAQKVSGGGRRGGSMYSAMARTAYTLAPAAALLATAAIVIKKRKSHKSKHSKKTRKSLRRRR
jgi:thiol-disulfide isomerase/thioredoxin